jgi:hypothetical protein
MAQETLVGYGLLILEGSRSHLDTWHSIGLLWTSDQPDAKTSTVTTDRHPCPPKGFEPTIPASERPKSHALDRAVTGIGVERLRVVNYSSLNYCLIVSISDFFTTKYKELSSERQYY